MLEGIIAWFCLFGFFITKDIEILKVCGIFSIASYLYHLESKEKGE